MSEQQIKEKVREAIANDPNRNVIAKVSLFGSYLHGKAKPESDIDLLIEFKPQAAVGLFKLVSIKRGLENYLHREVDLVTPSALSKYFKDEVLKQAVTIYEG